MLSFDYRESKEDDDLFKQDATHFKHKDKDHPLFGDERTEFYLKAAEEFVYKKRGIPPRGDVQVVPSFYFPGTSTKESGSYVYIPHVFWPPFKEHTYWAVVCFHGSSFKARLRGYLPIQLLMCSHIAKPAAYDAKASENLMGIKSDSVVSLPKGHKMGDETNQAYASWSAVERVGTGFLLPKPGPPLAKALEPDKSPEPKETPSAKSTSARARWRVGTQLDLKFDGVWYGCMIREISEATKTILLTFEGYDSGFDKWVSRDSLNLAPYRKFSKPVDRNTLKLGYVKSGTAHKGTEVDPAEVEERRIKETLKQKVVPVHEVVEAQEKLAAALTKQMGDNATFLANPLFAAAAAKQQAEALEQRARDTNSVALPSHGESTDDLTKQFRSKRSLTPTPRSTTEMSLKSGELQPVHFEEKQTRKVQFQEPRRRGRQKADVLVVHGARERGVSVGPGPIVRDEFMSESDVQEALDNYKRASQMNSPESSDDSDSGSSENWVSSSDDEDAGGDNSEAKKDVAGPVAETVASKRSQKGRDLLGIPKSRSGRIRAVSSDDSNLLSLQNRGPARRQGSIRQYTDGVHPRDVILSGYLKKQGGGTSLFGKRNVKKRWFLLANCQLRYYENREAYKNGDRPLKNSVIHMYRKTVKLVDPAKGYFTITSVDQNDRTYHLYAENPEADQDLIAAWVEGLQRATAVVFPYQTEWRSDRVQ